MELSQFLHTEVIKYFDTVINNYKNKKTLIRNEELGLFNLQKDYEGQITRAMKSGEVVKAKKLYDEILNKFNTNLDKAVADKILKLLDNVTEVIRTHVKKYNQELLLKPELDKYEAILNKKRSIPQEISGEASDISFFNEEESARLNEEAEKATDPENTINLTVNPLIQTGGSASTILPENQLLSNNIANADKKELSFKKAKIKYDKENPSHIIEMFSKYKNGYLILAQSIIMDKPEVFFIDHKPKQEEVIIT